MSREPTTFWEHVYNLRVRGRIPRVWKASDLRRFLEEPGDPAFSPNTITAYPFNSSVSLEGHGIGDFVKKGAVPRAWRVGRGQFRLVEDPADDVPIQGAERRRAMHRAAELRARRIPANGRPGAAPASAPVRSGSISEPLPSSASPYPSFSVALNPMERRDLASLSTDDKAVSIVRKHLVDRFGDRVQIEEDRDGVDLSISIDGRRERIEVKGTDSPTLAWQQLKVSSQRSHDALTSGAALMYRVVDVSGLTPRIYVLTHGRHFILAPEPRWTVQRVPPKDDRYPLRGEPYRYDLPYAPVAADDWEIRP